MSKSTIEELVVLNSQAMADLGVGRVGTIVADRDKLVEAFGEPNADYTESDGKVTDGKWIFSTPRGGLCIYKYWWNKGNEWSVTHTPVSADRIAAFKRDIKRMTIWIRMLCKAKGIRMLKYGAEL